MRFPWSRRQQMLSCQEVVELVTAYLEDSLPPARHALVQAHLAECADCGRYLDQVRATIAAIGSLPPEALDEAAYGALAAAFRDLPRDGG